MSGPDIGGVRARAVVINALIKTLGTATGGDEKRTADAVAAVGAWIALEAEIAARLGEPHEGIEDLGRRLFAAGDERWGK